MATKQDMDFALDLCMGQADAVLDERLDHSKELASVVNLRLSPVRDGEPGKCPEVALKSLPAGATSACMGIAPLGEKDAAIAYYLPKTGQKRLYSGCSVISEPRSTQADAAGQNGYFPIKVAASWQSAAGEATFFESVAANQGTTWSCVRRDVSGTYGAFVSVRDGEGVLLVNSQLVYTPPANTKLMKITQHGANSVWLWSFADGVAIEGRKLTLSGTSITVSAPVTLWTPATTDYPDVVGDDTYAWVIARHPSVANDMRIVRVNVETNAQSTLDLAGFGNGFQFVRCALAQCRVRQSAGGALTRFVGVVCSSTVALTCMAVINADTMALVWSQTGVSLGGVAVAADFVACAFRCTGFTYASQLWVALSDTSGSVGSTNVPRTVFEVRDIATGVGATSHTDYWMNVLGRSGCSWDAAPGSDTPEVYAFFQMRRTYGSDPLLDPALCLALAHYNADGTAYTTPVGRFAQDSSGFLFWGSTSVSGNRMAVGFNAVCVELDLRPTQIPVVESDGCAFVAAAQPVVWDGSETVEYGPIFRPAVYAAAGGSGSAITPGDYRYVAVYEWFDAAGNKHRSAPSYPESITFIAADVAYVAVTTPYSMRNWTRQGGYTVTLYSSRWDGSAASLEYYAVASTNDAPSGGRHVFQGIGNPSASNALLYSRGTSVEELLPEAPPALWDVAAAGDRLIAILAEFRTEVVYTKPKSRDPGTRLALEFSAYNRCAFPQGAGRLMAIRTLGQTPILFAERGIFALDGQGTDARGQGLPYGAPRQLSTVGCASRESVVVTPAGIFFAAKHQGKTRFAVFNGDGVRVFDRVEYKHTLGAIVFEHASEVAFLCSSDATLDAAIDAGGAFFIVYNWRKDGWTRWGPNRHRMRAPASVAGAGVFATRALASDTPVIGYMHTDTFAPGAQGYTTWHGQAYIDTGWIQPAGEQGDCVQREVWFSARSAGSHSITISVQYDYGRAGLSLQTETWTNAQRTADSSGKYTVALKLKHPEARAIRVTVSEDLCDGEGCKPLSLHIYHDAQVGPLRRSVPDGNRR